MILALCTSFLTTSFSTTSLSLLKSTGTGTNWSTSNLPSLLFKLVQTFFKLSVSNLSTLDVELAKSTCLRNFDASKPVSFGNLITLHC